MSAAHAMVGKASFFQDAQGLAAASGPPAKVQSPSFDVIGRYQNSDLGRSRLHYGFGKEDLAACL
jgi:hypothetical protein